MMRVVCNASPLIYLAKIGRLGLLKDLFGRVLVPLEVHREVVMGGEAGNHPEVASVRDAVREGWLAVRKAPSDPALDRLSGELDRGELEVIALARRTKADIVLMDDSAARRAAEALGLKPRGTIHVILKAHRRKLLSRSDAKRAVRRLISSGFRISAEVYAAVLAELD